MCSAGALNEDPGDSTGRAQVPAEVGIEQAGDGRDVGDASRDVVPEEWLVVGHSVAQTVQTSDGAVDVAPVSARCERLVEGWHPQRLLMGGGAEEPPEAEHQLSNDLAGWSGGAAGGVHGTVE